MTKEGIPVKLYSLIPNSWMERAGALRIERIERCEGWSWDSLVAGATEKENDQKLEESPVSSEKCLSQETREPLGAMSHRERL